MAERIPSKKGTGQFMRQGHTASEYGNDPAVSATSRVAAAPRDLKP